MGLYIRDDTVRDLARRLAEKRRTTVTEAVRQALEHALVVPLPRSSSRLTTTAS